MEKRNVKNIPRYLIMLLINYLIYISSIIIFLDYLNINIYYAVLLINFYQPVITYLIMKYFVFNKVNIKFKNKNLNIL